MTNTESDVAAEQTGERTDIDTVRRFWDAHPCDTPKAQSNLDRRRFFENIEATRYREQPHIPLVAGFGGFAGKSVLEIGCGVGTDGAQFAKAGAQYTGVDLTDAAIALSRENFRLRYLNGSFQRIDAEALPFPSESFDHVYSFGVIHQL